MILDTRGTVAATHVVVGEEKTAQHVPRRGQERKQAADRERERESRGEREAEIDR